MFNDSHGISFACVEIATTHFSVFFWLIALQNIIRAALVQHPVLFETIYVPPPPRSAYSMHACASS